MPESTGSNSAAFTRSDTFAFKSAYLPANSTDCNQSSRSVVGRNGKSKRRGLHFWQLVSPRSQRTINTRELCLPLISGTVWPAFLSRLTRWITSKTKSGCDRTGFPAPAPS